MTRLWHIEGANGMYDVLGLFSPEEIIFIFVCILCEVNMVFVSDSLRKLSTSM